MNSVILALTWLFSSFSILFSASITCMSCATKQAVTHWNKFVNYRVMNPQTGKLIDDHPCENAQNLTCNGLCYIFEISGTNKVDGTSQLFAMALGCSVGLFDGEEGCFDRPITVRGRGGNFHLNGHYCLCNGNRCNQNSEIWIQHGPKKFHAQRQKAGAANRNWTSVTTITIIYFFLTMKRLI